MVARTFADPRVDFISGPYLPRWGAPAPVWLPKEFPAVIGWMEAGNRTLEYGRDYDGVMMGGNAVVRTAAGRSAGWYDASLGRVGTRAGSGCEDVDFFERLLQAGFKGYYVPELAIYHYIPPYRLTKRYHREWCFRRSVAQSELDSLRRQPVAYFLGVPRYMIGTAIRSDDRSRRSRRSREMEFRRGIFSRVEVVGADGFRRGHHQAPRPPSPTRRHIPCCVAQSWLVAILTKARAPLKAAVPARRVTATATLQGSTAKVCRQSRKPPPRTASGPTWTTAKCRTRVKRADQRRTTRRGQTAGLVSSTGTMDVRLPT